ncbi:uncharacterized protein LODBEIA_P32190 [Lodderomyces beijingensis]|uniref:Uncharacterized protein n=1 Tax=Lodderomyces beijingensis TaxID=1775926 RepID=A0ABP0ZLG7_9ASCO
MSSEKTGNESSVTAASDSTHQQQQQPQELNQADLAKIQDITQKILNPNGEHPQVNDYIQSTFSYIGNALKKMQETDDKQATAKEIADDLTQKFEQWAAQKKQEAEQKRAETKTESTEEKK